MAAAKTIGAIALGLVLFIPVLAVGCVLVVVFLSLSFTQMIFDAFGHDEVNVFPRWMEWLLEKTY